jgi:hypothetical protein
MASPFLQYLLENIDSESPGDQTVAPGQTEAVMYFIIDWDQMFKLTAGGDLIYAMWQEILGSSAISTKNWAVGGALPIRGGLTRSIPMSFPGDLGTSLYAYEFSMQPYSPDGKIADTPWNIFYSGPIPGRRQDYYGFTYLATYKKVRLEIKFKTRNYFILNDEQLEDAILYPNLAVPRDYIFYDKKYRNVNIPAGGKRVEIFSDPVTYYDFCEYLRYTEINVEPNNEIIVNTQGKLYWRSILGDPEFSPINNAPITKNNSSANYQTIIKNKVKIKWYQIPKIVIQNPKYAYHMGKVNYGWNYDEQTNPEVFNYPFFKFANGTLLFTGIETTESQFSFPRARVDDSELSLWNNLFSNQYYDITFNFIQYVIPETQLALPSLGSLDLIIKGQMYSNGWNFAPLPNNIFYYAQSVYGIGALVKGTIPPYWSVPFQSLFNPQFEV